MKKSELRQMIVEEVRLYEQETALFNKVFDAYSKIVFYNKDLRKTLTNLVKSKSVPSVMVKRVFDLSNELQETLGTIQSMWQ